MNFHLSKVELDALLAVPLNSIPDRRARTCFKAILEQLDAETGEISITGSFIDEMRICLNQANPRLERALKKAFERHLGEDFLFDFFS